MLESKGLKVIIPVHIQSKGLYGLDCDQWTTVYVGDLEYNPGQTYQFIPFGPRYDLENGWVLEEDQDVAIGKCRLVMEA